MKATDKLGYFIMIVGFILFCDKYLTLVIYSMTYLLFGGDYIGKVVDITLQNDRYVYEISIGDSTEPVMYKSVPTKKVVGLTQSVNVKTVPIFNRVLLGKVPVIGMIFVTTVMLYLTFISILSLCLLLNIKLPPVLYKFITRGNGSE